MAQIGKIRSYKTEPSSGQRRKRRRRDAERGFRGSGLSWRLRLFTIWLPLILLVTGVAGIFYYQKLHRSATTGSAAVAAPPVEDDSALVATMGRPPEEVAEKFLHAPDAATRLQWVRKPDVVAADLRAFFTSGPGATEQVEKFTALPAVINLSANITRKDVELARYAVTLTDGRMRLLVILKTDEGARADFACYARHTSAPWTEILAGRSPGAKVRVFVEPDHFYLGAFGDEREWRSLHATSPDADESLYLYARRSDPALKELTQLTPGPARRMLLKISPPKDPSARRQFQVDAIISGDWVE